MQTVQRSVHLSNQRGSVKSHIRLGTHRFGQFLDVARFHHLNANVVTDPDHPPTRHGPGDVKVEYSMVILLRQFHDRFRSRVERRRIPSGSQREQQSLGGNQKSNFVVCVGLDAIIRE